MPSFTDFSLQPATQAALTAMKITEPTPIQAAAIPALLAGRDLVGQSATGSGKTLAYSVPLVERLARDRRVVQALVLVPTRELAVQVNNVLSRLAAARRMTTALLVGGRPYGPQISSLRYGSQIVVGTPGRIKDHLERGSLVMSELRMCILDEADQMLDSGFAPVIEDILATTPETRQMALFSATMPDWVAKIQQKFLKDPVRVDITASAGAQSTIEQIAYRVPQDQKMAALCTLLQSTEGGSSLIFGRTKFGVEKLGKQLTRLGFTVGTLHGNKSQSAREKVLSAFRQGHVQTLLATNVAARGLDIRGINLVINYELPESSELFTHRIGRTGRMGQQGKAITLLAPSDVSKWRRMAHSLGQKVVLEQLVIDEDAMTPPPPTIQEIEAPVMPEPEWLDEPAPFRGRQSFSQRRESQPRDRQSFSQRQEPQRFQERGGRPDRSRRDNNQEAPVMRKRSNERTHGKTAAHSTPWLPEDFIFPESSFAVPARPDRQRADKKPGFNRSEGRSRTRAMPIAEPQQRPAGRKPRAATIARTRRTAAVKRSAGR